MKCSPASLVADAIVARRCALRSAAAMRHARRIAPWSATAILLGVASPANAQAIQNTMDPLGAPWNAQRIFEPSALPELEHRDTRDNNNEPVPPEDTPVKGRQHQGYEPVGIRSGRGGR